MKDEERRALVRTTEDQSVLAIAALYEKDSLLRCEIIKEYLADSEQEIFREVALGGAGYNCRREAIRRLADTEQETFRKVALGDDDYACRREAIKRLAYTEQETLKKVVLVDWGYGGCRREAIKRLNRKNLVEIAPRVWFFAKCRIFFRLLKLRFIGESTPALSGPAKEAKLIYDKKDVSPVCLVAIEEALSSQKEAVALFGEYEQQEASLEKQIRTLRELIDSAKKGNQAFIRRDEEPILAEKMDRTILSMEEALSLLVGNLADIREAKKEEQEKTKQATAVFERVVRSSEACKVINDLEKKLDSWSKDTVAALTPKEL